MKKFSLLVCLVLSSNLVLCQVLDPATWDLSVSKGAVKIGEELNLVFEVSIEENWILYANDFDPSLGPAPATFEFLPGRGYALIGEVEPVRSKRKYDPFWGGEVSYFEGKARFLQRIKVQATGLVIKGRYTYQVCNIADGKCILGEGDFVEKVNVLAAVPDKGKEGTLALPSGQTTRKERREAINEDEPLWEPFGSDASSIGNNRAGLVPFLLLAFLAGLAALLTPCVFPMIPTTVTFFTSRNNYRKKAVAKALVYGLSILVIYVLSGTVVAMVNGPDFARWLSTHWLPNVFFFAVFFVFGLSFLGLFEITLPSGLVNKADRESDKGGYYGVFFMAFTLVLVSFSCTGPIVGSILVASAGGEIVKPVLGMLSFSLAFATPFTLFAVFPKWLNSLPKSGGWLNCVKVCLGFLELALSLKFLSVADQVYHWGILDREVYLSLWIVIFFFLGLYLLGKICLPHDSVVERAGVLRLLSAIIVFAFALYLVPGLFGAPLKALAGYLPPMSTQDFNLAGIARGQDPTPIGESSALCSEPKHDGFLELPHGLKGYFDYAQALGCAKEQHKPLFIDFTGHGCVNCREMEARVWSDPEVLSRLKNDYIVVALYVDEKAVLPEREWYASAYDGEIKKTIGKQNADFQITRFNNNAQPYYAILDPYTKELLNAPKGYDPDPGNFVRFLEAGARAFRGK